MNKFKPIKWFKMFYSLSSTLLSNRMREIVGRRNKVRWLTWEATDACNSRCQLCSIWQTKQSPDLLSSEEIKKAFSDPLFKDLEVLLITGGEPVLRDDLFELISFIHDKYPKVRFTLSTNGLLPDKVIKVVEASLKKGIGIDVGISLDGIGEHHDLMRGVKGNFEKVDYLVNQLVSLKKEFCDLGLVLGQTLHPLTLSYVDEVKTYAEKHGITYLAQIYDEGPYYDNIGKSNIVSEEIAKMTEIVKKFEPSFHNEILLKILKDKIVEFDCFTLRSFFILRCNGDVMPCLRLCDIKIGNVRESSPSEIWNSEVAREARKTVKACKGCANTWATDWSMESNFIPFSKMLFSAFVKKKF